MALANALGTHQCVCLLQAPNHYQRSNGMAVANAWEHTNVCANCKPRIITREATAWLLQNALGTH
jgi:hypothetical protein